MLLLMCTCCARLQAEVENSHVPHPLLTHDLHRRISGDQNLQPQVCLLWEHQLRLVGCGIFHVLYRAALALLLVLGLALGKAACRVAEVA